MTTTISMSEYSRASVSECLLGFLRALDGFPVAELFHDYVLAVEIGSSSPRRAATLVDHVLGCWITALKAEMHALPPATSELILSGMRGCSMHGWCLSG